MGIIRFWSNPSVDVTELYSSRVSPLARKAKALRIQVCKFNSKNLGEWKKNNPASQYLKYWQYFPFLGGAKAYHLDVSKLLCPFLLFFFSPPSAVSCHSTLRHGYPTSLCFHNEGIVIKVTINQEARKICGVSPQATILIHNKLRAIPLP